MRYFLSTFLTILIFTATTYADEVSLSEFQYKVSVIHSHKWFKGFFYFGSDENFHYFQEEWDFRVDPKYEIDKDKVELTIEFPHKEKKLQFSPIEGYGYKVFFITGGRKYYLWE